jgi:uridylate kinase
MEVVIISLGGSIIVPKGIDVKFLREFKKAIIKQPNKKFLIVTGGGKTCRIYQDASAKIFRTKQSDLDWIGIASTHLNAQLIRSIFGSYAHDMIITNPEKKIYTRKNVVIGAGWKPGHSTDLDAVVLAKTYKACKIINMSNIDYLYDKDPKHHKDAKRILKTDWKTLQKFVGNRWKPGLNMPFDPIAVKLAKMQKIELTLIGKDIKNLINVLNNKRFKGTTVK